jgi:AraC family transcriptional regulator
MSETYRPQVERAVKFIADRLDRPITVREVARVAHLSEFHFHRIFTAVVGEPIGRFTTRLRLETAALLLAYRRDRSVGDIALRCGYSSISNFSKAFSGHFGCSPSRLRRPGGDLPAGVDALAGRHGGRFHPRDLYTLAPEAPDEQRRARLAALTRALRFEQRPAVEVACLASPAGYDPAALDAVWAALIGHAHALGLCEDEIDAYGLAHDSPVVTAAARCRYHACVPCSAATQPPAPLFRARIPAGRYAIFRHAGPVVAAEATYRAIYSLWFPQSSVVADDFVAVDHYVEDGPVDGEITYDILIKVRPRGG